MQAQDLTSTSGRQYGLELDASEYRPERSLLFDLASTEAGNVAVRVGCEHPGRASFSQTEYVVLDPDEALALAEHLRALALPAAEARARTRGDRARFLADIITTAVEGGTGYWACVSRYEHPDDDPGATFAVLHEGLDDDDETPGAIVGNGPALLSGAPNPLEARYSPEGLQLDVDAIERGLTRLDELEGYAELKRAVREADACNIDANDADVIAQLALLGEVRYG